MRDITARAVFASTHRDEEESPHLHGHTFTVEVGEKQGDGSLEAHLSEVVSELHLRSLDDMLAGGAQDYHSIAAWIMERLLLRHPRLAWVEVSVADRPHMAWGERRETR
jgi:hypothetical protein